MYNGIPLCSIRQKTPYNISKNIMMNISNLLKYFRPRTESRILFKNHSLSRWLVFLFIGIAIIVTFIFAYILRFSFNLALDFGLVLKQSLLVLGIYLGFELIIKSFTGLRYHRTIKDILRIKEELITSS